MRPNLGKHRRIVVLRNAAPQDAGDGDDKDGSEEAQPDGHNTQVVNPLKLLLEINHVCLLEKRSFRESRLWKLKSPDWGYEMGPLKREET